MTPTHPLRLVVVLKQIRYSGDNIGNDLAFAFEVNGAISSFEQKIAAGKSRSVDKILWKAPAMEGDEVTFQVNAIGFTTFGQIFILVSWEELPGSRLPHYEVMPDRVCLEQARMTKGMC
jgi:hypothetical protein